MNRNLHFYMDDSGARHLDYVPKPPGSPDWFALGGILIAEEDEEAFRNSHSAFMQRWKIEAPLHSVKIRGRSKAFSWIDRLPAVERERFYNDLTSLIIDAPVTGTACVIDRPGYDQRYRERYGIRRWSLCKTAFTIACERAAKIATMQGRRLKVFVEEADKGADKKIRAYYDGLRSGGMPFNKDTSSQYGPLSPENLKQALYDLKFKKKSSPLIQLADLFLYPICRAAYEETYRPFLKLREHKRTVNCHLSEDALASLGIKHSCFDWKNTKGEDFSSPSPASLAETS